MFKDKYGPWAFIAGASMGIGRALSLEAAARGLNVVMNARGAETLAATAAEVRATHGVEVRELTADLTDPKIGMTVLAASAMCTRIDRISMLESLDMSGYANERMFRAMSIGLDPDDPAAPGMIEVSCGSFKEQIRVLAQALAIELNQIRFTAEFAAATDDVDFGFMKLEKGQISGFKGVIAGISGGRSVIECRFVWKVGDKMTPNWSVEDGYVLEIEGDPGVQVRLAPIGSAHFASAGPTAMPAINGIPHVVAAAPGIVNHADLPFVTGRHLLNRENA